MNPRQKEQLANIVRSLTNQAPKDEAIIQRFEYIRGAAKELAEAIVLDAVPGREQSLAITKLEECVMWAIKSIALNQDVILDPPEESDF